MSEGFHRRHQKAHISSEGIRRLSQKGSEGIRRLSQKGTEGYRRLRAFCLPFCTLLQKGPEETTILMPSAEGFGGFFTLLCRLYIALRRLLRPLYCHLKVREVIIHPSSSPFLGGMATWTALWIILWLLYGACGAASHGTCLAPNSERVSFFSKVSMFLL